jgi:hypothetical protein
MKKMGRFGVRGLSVVLLTALAACSAADDGTDDTSEGAVSASTEFAGLFDSFPHAEGFQDGTVWQLDVRPDGRFSMFVQGLYGCDRYAGYSCPSSWSDGYAGWTQVDGEWKARAGGVTLQPKGEGRPSDPIKLDLAIHGTQLDLSGTIVPNRHIDGHLTVRALDAKPHTAKEADLGGNWVADTSMDDDGDHPSITGSSLYVRDYKHLVVFDAASRTLGEARSNIVPKTLDAGKYRVAGAPDGSGAGVLIFNEQWPEHETIALASADRLTFDFGGGRSLSMHRMTPNETATGVALDATKLGVLRVSLDDAEIKRQASSYPSTVNFGDALRAALDSFVTNADDPESVRALAADLPADHPCHRVDTARAARCLIDDSKAMLTIVETGKLAEHGEEVQANWIFKLSVPSLSDHVHFAVVDRSGKTPAYNYGVN